MPAWHISTGPTRLLAVWPVRGPHPQRTAGYSPAPGTPPAIPPDRALVSVPFRYAMLKENVSTPVYKTMKEAQKRHASGNHRRGRLRFIAYLDSFDTDDNGKPNYFHLSSDTWVSVDSVATRISAMPGFQGFNLPAHPRSIHSAGSSPLTPRPRPKRTPGKEVGDYTGHVLTEYDQVQIYAVQKVGEEEWFLVAPDEWLEASLVGRVIPNTTPPLVRPTGAGSRSTCSNRLWRYMITASLFLPH